MNKKELFINTRQCDPERGRTCCNIYLEKSDYPHIYIDHEITNDELAHALDIVATAMMQRDSHTLIVDLDERERFLAPPVEMTLAEIEQKLGYKVKVVSEEKKHD